MSSLVHPCRSLYECLSSDSRTARCNDCRMPGNVDRGLAICWPVPEIATLEAYSRTLQIYSHCRQVVMSAVSMIGMNMRVKDAVHKSLRLVTLLHKLFEASWALQHKSDTAVHKNFVVATWGSACPRRVILLSWDWRSILHHHGMTRVIDWTCRV